MDKDIPRGVRYVVAGTGLCMGTGTTGSGAGIARGRGLVRLAQVSPDKARITNLKGFTAVSFLADLVFVDPVDLTVAVVLAFC